MHTGSIEKKLLEPPRPCPNPECTSSDGFHIWQKGEVIDGYCFVCNRASDDPYGDLLKSEGNTPPITKASVKTYVADSPANQQLHELSVEDGLTHPIRGIPDRGISYATAEHFGVRIGVSSTDGATPIYTLFPRYRNEDLVGWKIRTAEKRFYSTGGNNVDLFGANACKPQGKKLYITEGEYDALSVFQALKENSSLEGYNHAVVSLPSGAASALKCITLSELTDQYEELVLVFDNDEAGKNARDEVCKAYAGKVSYVNIPYPHKDANDMLMSGKSNDLKWLCLTGAKKYHPDGIVQVKNLKEELHSEKEVEFFPYPDDMPELNAKIYGAKKGTLTSIIAGTSVGKTAFLHKLFHHFIKTTDEKIAGMFLEEDKLETINNIIGLEVCKRITLPDVNISKEEKDEAFDKLFNNNRVSLYDFFGGMDDSSLLSKLRYFAVTGHTIIFLDHLSFVISEFATEGDERKKIDVLMNKLAKFVKEFNVVLFLVVHVKKAESNAITFEQGAVPTLDSPKGSSSIKQASWDVIALSRNQQHTNEYCKNVTELTVLKCRLTGRSGVADYLHFNEHTGLMSKVDKPHEYRHVKGISRG